jgi:hypothetical protein
VLVKQTETYGWAIKIPPHLFKAAGTEVAGAITKLLQWLPSTTMTTEVLSFSPDFSLSLDTPSDDANHRPIILVVECGERDFSHENSDAVKWTRIPNGRANRAYDYVARP